MPSANHIEQMAMDQGALLAWMYPELAREGGRLRVPRFLDRMRAGAALSLERFDDDLVSVAATWPSDTARGWAAFAVGMRDRPLPALVAEAVVYGADPHFAVREWAWLGIRGPITGAPVGAVEELQRLTSSKDPNIRRFAVEATRPRGVWSRHIPLLLREPWIGERLLDAVIDDPSRYVQDSVANWVNDVSRSNPDWVRATCLRWALGSGTRTRAYVLRRAQRSLRG